MNSDYSGKTNNHQHAKIVLDYSFCNSSDFWNYLGLLTILLFLTTLLSYLKHRQRQKVLHHHRDQYAWMYLSALIVLGLVFVVPFMCWSLTIVEILVTFIRYGQITASPLSTLSLPIRWLAFIYQKIVSSIHWYLTAPGTFIFLLFFIALKSTKIALYLTLRFHLWGVFLCAWFAFAMPLYALIEVGTIDSWIDLAFNCQLPLLIILKFLPSLLAIRSLILWVFLYLIFLLGYSFKFGFSMLFVCKCFVLVVLVRFTYVIGKALLVLVISTVLATNTSRDTDDVQ